MTLKQLIHHYLFSIFSTSLVTALFEYMDYKWPTVLFLLTLILTTYLGMLSPPLLIIVLETCLTWLPPHAEGEEGGDYDFPHPGGEEVLDLFFLLGQHHQMQQ